MRMRPGPADGMTLIELVIAIALLALITTMSYRGLDSLSRSSDRLIGESERWQNVALFFARFASDVKQPVARPIHIGATQAAAAGAPAAAPASPPSWPLPGAATAGLPATLVAAEALRAAGAGAMPADAQSTPRTPSAPSLPAWLGQPLAALAEDASGREAALEFTRKSPTGRDEVRLGYRLRGSRLELLIWPALDRAPDSRPEIYTLLDGVSALHFRHLDAAGAWQERWPASEGDSAMDTLPRAVEIEVTLRDGTRLRRVFALPS